MSHPTLYFFKLRFQDGVCPACQFFDNTIFTPLTNDMEVRRAVNLEKIEFGTNEDGHRLSLERDFPDLKSKVTYGPYIYLIPPYDERLGYHLNPNTMNYERLNKRLDGMLFDLDEGTTLQTFKNWLIDNAAKFS